MHPNTRRVYRGMIFSQGECISLPGKNALLAYRLPDERTEYLAAAHGLDWAFVSLAVDRQFRDWLKYGHDFKSADEALAAARAHLREEIAGRNINLEMIA